MRKFWNERQKEINERKRREKAIKEKNERKQRTYLKHRSKAQMLKLENAAFG